MCMGAILSWKQRGNNISRAAQILVHLALSLTKLHPWPPLQTLLLTVFFLTMFLLLSNASWAFLITNFCWLALFFKFAGPLWWWAPGHCPNADRVSPPLAQIATNTFLPTFADPFPGQGKWGLKSRRLYGQDSGGLLSSARIQWMIANDLRWIMSNFELVIHTNQWYYDKKRYTNFVNTATGIGRGGQGGQVHPPPKPKLN